MRGREIEIRLSACTCSFVSDISLPLVDDKSGHLYLVWLFCKSLFFAACITISNALMLHPRMPYVFVNVLYLYGMYSPRISLVMLYHLNEIVIGRK